MKCAETAIKELERRAVVARVSLAQCSVPLACITDVDTTAISKLTKSAPRLAIGLVPVVIVVRFMAKTQQLGTMRRNESMTDLVWCGVNFIRVKLLAARALYSVSGFRTVFCAL